MTLAPIRSDSLSGLLWGTVAGLGLCVTFLLLLLTAAPHAATFSGYMGDDATSAFYRLFAISIDRVALALTLACQLVAMLVWAPRDWLDPDRWARQSLRSVLFPARRTIALLTIVLAPLLLPRELFAGFAIAGVLLLLLTPFFVWSEAALDASRLTRWWKPHWPGWRIVVMFFAIESAWAGFTLLVGVTADLAPTWLGLTLELVLFPASTAVVLLQGSYWIDRARPPSPTLKWALHWRRFAPALWLDMAIAGILMPLGAAWVGLVAFAVYVAPQIHYNLKQAGAEPDRFVEMFAHAASQDASAYFWLWGLVTWFACLCLGRLIWLARGTEPCAEPQRLLPS